MLSGISPYFALAALVALSTACTHDAGGQTPGDRIRIVVPSLGRVPIEGTMAGIDVGVVRLDTGNPAPLVVPREDVQALFVLHERRNGLVGAVIGTVIGSALGGTVSAAMWEPCPQTDGFDFCFRSASRSNAFHIGALAGAVPGLLIGAIAGSLIPSHEWRSVDLNLSFSPERSAQVPRGRSVSPTVRLTIPLDR